MSTSLESTIRSQRLAGRRVAVCGKFGGMSRRDVQKLVREHGGVAVEDAAAADLIVVGEKELPLDDALGEGLFNDSIRQAAEAGLVSVIGETELWRRLGLLEEAFGVRRLYTTAMLADLLRVPVAVVRRWHRRGLIVPQREIRRLAYFDFEEVATARSLAHLLSAGISPAALEKKLSALARFLPGAQRRLTQLSIIVEGKQLLLRQGDGLLDAGGQLRFDFEAAISAQNRSAEESTISLESGPTSYAWETLPEEIESEADAANDSVEGRLEPETVLALDSLAANLPVPSRETPVELVRAAYDLEDEGRLEEAAELYRAALAAGGPTAELNFRLAELLYRTGDVAAARERYYMAIELDEDFVEARANLGCVLFETGQRELAAAAFEGALAFHPEYADAHYQLARTLDDLGRGDEAQAHWRTFLDLAPESPWAAEAQARLGEAGSERIEK